MEAVILLYIKRSGAHEGYNAAQWVLAEGLQSLLKMKKMDWRRLRQVDGC